MFRVNCLAARDLGPEAEFFLAHGFDINFGDSVDKRDLEVKSGGGSPAVFAKAKDHTTFAGFYGVVRGVDDLKQHYCKNNDKDLAHAAEHFCRGTP